MNGVIMFYEVTGRGKEREKGEGGRRERENKRAGLPLWGLDYSFGLGKDQMPSQTNQLTSQSFTAGVGLSL